MDNMIKGYQYGNENHYIGEYIFHNNLDKEEIHLPHNTTLVEPPVIPEGKSAVWNENENKWFIVDKISLPYEPQPGIDFDLPTPDYPSLEVTELPLSDVPLSDVPSE